MRVSSAFREWEGGEVRPKGFSEGRLGGEEQLRQLSGRAGGDGHTERREGARGDHAYLDDLSGAGEQDWNRGNTRFD